MDWPEGEYEVVCVIGAMPIATRATKLRWNQETSILSFMGDDGRMRYLRTGVFHVTEVTPSGIVRVPPAEPLSLVKP